MENVKVNVVDTKQCSVTLSVEVPHPEVLQETERVYVEIQKSAQVPGFRAGKAPLELIKKNFVSTAREKVVESLVTKSMFKALKDQEIEPVTYPIVEELHFDFDKPFSFKVKAERHPKFDIKSYKGIKIKKEIRAVNDAKVSETINGLRERNARLQDSQSDTVGEKNMLLVDYDGYSGEENVKELGAKNQLIDLSAAQLMAGFKEGLTGAKKGEEKEIKVKLPANYPKKELAGKDVVFKVRISEIKEKVVPALDDDLAKDFSCASLAELQKKVKETLEAEEKNRQEQEMQKQALDHLIEQNKFTVPESLISEELQYMESKAKKYLQSQGMPESVFTQNEKQWREKYQAEAERNVKISYLLNEISKTEKIEITEEDLKSEKSKLFEMNKGREKEVEKYYGENKDHIASHMKEEKIYKLIFDNAKIKEDIK
ncbi:MAG: trigger factor [Elusimicrobiota bacterium]